MKITLYGIPNCDTVKKARAWLTAQGLDYRSTTSRNKACPPTGWSAWLHCGWETLVNRKGTTWRKLDADGASQRTDAASAQALMLAHPSVIKRPVVEWGRQTTVGFDPDAWQALR
jgi:arsenate reductase